MLEELIDWLKIPSISSGGGDPADLVRAAEWAAEKVRDAGGSAEVIEGEVNPLVIGELRAEQADAPVVMIYGHYDVQSAAPLDLWTTPPFEPEVRGDRLYGRGTSDDKGNFYPLLYVACELAAQVHCPSTSGSCSRGRKKAPGTASTVGWNKTKQRQTV